MLFMTAIGPFQYVHSEDIQQSLAYKKQLNKSPTRSISEKTIGKTIGLSLKQSAKSKKMVFYMQDSALSSWKDMWSMTNGWK